MLQQGSVLMAYGLNPEKFNCQRVFNLFCLFGNVVRVKFLKIKDGVAMVQMGDHVACQRAIDLLSGNFAFGSKLSLGTSKQAFIQDVYNPVDLHDGSPSFADYMGSRNNRFSTPEAAAKNRIKPVSRQLYFFNCPPNIDEGTLRKVFTDAEATPPESIRIFQSRNERSSTGIMEFSDKTEATEALILCNHTNIPNPSGKAPYVLKMCFTSSNRP
jgi:heterogeneous nuclear ribonucleoprotein L